MHKMLIIFGTRPEITKLAPIIRKVPDYNMEAILVHSGQHYSDSLSKAILDDLGIPELHENLQVGSGSHGKQTAKMLERYEEVILKYKPKIVLALGDTNSVVAAGLVCSKLNIPFGHIEAGIRSFDMTMPEEINRRVAAVNASIHFAPSHQAVLNLLYEGIDPKGIFYTGNTAIDATIEHTEIARRKSNILEKLDIIDNRKIITLTLHRAGNVDNKVSLENLLTALRTLKDYTFVFPIHPRTRKRLEEFNLFGHYKKIPNLIIIEPLSYLDFLKLMQSSILIMTDSGGLQEEALVLKKPCVTLRTNTERPETVKLGVNFLVGMDTQKIIRTIRKVSEDKSILTNLNSIKNPYGEGNASHKILEIIKEKLESGNLKFKPPSLIERGSLEFKLLKIEKDNTVEGIEKKYQAKVTLVYNKDLEPQPILTRIPKGWYVRILF